ncbi:MAG: serine/threonine protein kinase [Sandaracinaceae bacterium]|nr:serine/threonine protein kinase [Sandaracinaceae bacterium]
MSGENEPGKLIGERYELVRKIGEGGMAEVWQATQLNLGRDVALKLLRPHVAANTTSRKRFEREARVASALTHPNVVRIHDFGEASGQLYLAMELLEGYPLRDIVDAHLPLLPIERTIRIVTQIADALAAAHDMGLVHRDVKPENVFVQPTSKGGDRVVVVDFGLAFIEGDTARGRMTREGRVAGTPDYMSPEQITGSVTGAASDVYSLGCLLYEMLTSRVPFTGDRENLAYQHLLEPPRPPREARRDLAIPAELDDLCMRMLGKLAGERPDMETVRGTLDSLGSDSPERSRTQRYLQGRAGRMVAAPDALTHGRATESIRPPGDPVEVAVIGRMQGDLVLGLGANGLIPFVVSEDQPIAGAAAIFAPGVELDELRRLRSTETVPIVTDADAKDMTRIAELVTVGVDEVVPRPATTAQISHKIWRAIRRARRRSAP